MKSPINYTVLIICLLLVISTQAQGLEDVIGFDDEVNDAPAAPIQMLIPLALAIGVLIGFKKLK